LISSFERISSGISTFFQLAFDFSVFSNGRVYPLPAAGHGDARYNE
jgi:hypothetical protein